MKFKRLEQDKIDRELAQHFDEMNEKFNKMTPEQIQHGLIFANSEFSIVHKIIKSEYFTALKADIHKLNQKIQDGENINNWIFKHIPNHIKKICGLKSVSVEFIPDSFEIPELTFLEGNCSVKYHYFSKMSEENFDELIFEIIGTCIRESL